MGGKSGPRPPNPYVVAEAQTQANRQAIADSAQMNRYNTVSPFGNVLWNRPNDPAAPWTQSIDLNPMQREQISQQQEIATGLGRLGLGQIDQIPTDRFSLEGLPELRTDFGDQAGELERATYDRAMQLMTPGFEQQERRLQTQLATQGIPIGSEAYETETENFRRGMREAELAAALESVGRGRQEQSRLFGLNQAARQQGISDLVLERTQPMNELAALLQGSPALQTPQVPGTAQYQQSPADISGLIQGNYQQRSANRNAAKAGMANLAGSGMTAGALAAKPVAMCIPEGQTIDTPVGPVPIEKLTAGDMVIGFNGKPVKIMMHHAYVENPEPKRFATVVIGNAEINLCDKHRIDGIRSEDLRVGDEIRGHRVESIEWYNGVERSYDLLTEDNGYQIGGVPVNSMIDEMMRIAVNG